MTELKERMRALAGEVEHAMTAMIGEAEGARGRVVDAMRYACLAGGKRLRPFLVVASADLFEAPRSRSMRVAAALEMIHTYSLVHDDLPAMDDADLRRGRPSTHKEYDEATGILAGDALLTLAFEVLADAETHPDAEIRTRLIAGLAEASGAAGMVGGQMIDLEAEGKALDLDGITELQALKTGALIRFSCLGGGIVGGADAAQLAKLKQYAEDLGLAFQIVDDLLDAFGDEAALGKPAGQDAEMEKATFVKLLGADGARAKASELVDRACAEVDGFGPGASVLQDVAKFVLTRSS